MNSIHAHRRRRLEAMAAGHVRLGALEQVHRPECLVYWPAPCIHTYMHACIHTCIHTYTIHTHTRICKHACTHVHTGAPEGLLAGAVEREVG